MSNRQTENVSDHIDLILKIALFTESTQDMLNIALCCKRFSEILKSARRITVLKYFTNIELIDIGDKYDKKYKHKIRTNWKLHREDGPAIEWGNGDKHWYVNDKLHREDGPAIECSNGTKNWVVNGIFHREDGPAIEWSNGDKEWWVNGKRHREDGPAVEWSDGTKWWYINDKQLTKNEFKKYQEEKRCKRIKHE